MDGWELPTAILCGAVALILIVRAIARARKTRDGVQERLDR